jgi:tripartite-type tricarboxylate transporter receptor subunit TctC
MKKILLLIILLFTSTCYSFNIAESPVTVVIPFAPGGGVDSTFRNMQKYAAIRNIQMIPRYKPGVEGILGIKDLNESPKNGYTVGLTTSGSLGYYEAQNMKPSPNILTGIIGGNSVFVTYTNSNINTITDLEKIILSGKPLNIGVAHAGQRMAFDQLYEVIKSPYKPYYIMYKGAGQAVTDLLGGHIDILFIPITVAKPLVDSNKLKILATSKIQIKSIPTIESRYKQWKDIELHMFLLPNDTDSDAIKFWNSFLQDYLNNKDVREDFENNLAFTVPFSKSFAEEIVKLNSEKIANMKEQ